MSLMRQYQQMTNEALRIGLENGATSLRRLSSLAYGRFKDSNVPSGYKLCAISKAAGILAARKKSINRGYPTKNPRLNRPMLVSCYNFKLLDSKLRISLGNRKFQFIDLNKHTMRVLESDNDLEVRSYTITANSLSICIAKEVPEVQGIHAVLGVDRNLRNLTVGNKANVKYYDTSKVIEIGETTKDIVASFKRNDARVRKTISSKYGKRRTEKTRAIFHKISKDFVGECVRLKTAIAFENISHIRTMFRKGNGKGKDYRRLMNNHWPFGEIKRQIEYKATWAGIPIIHLTKKETRGTTMQCARCGERLQLPLQYDVQHKRKLWCRRCWRWFDRDLVAVMNISRKGWVRFTQSKGIGGEAMVEERVTLDDYSDPLILKVDPMKLPQK
jgi:putative transposase